MKHLKIYLLTIFSAIAMLLAALCASACGSSGITLTFLGGESEVRMLVQAGEEVTLPAPEKEGSAFDGWYASEDFSGTRYEGTMSAPDADTTYYARWETGYLLTLDADGGTLEKSGLWLKEGQNLAAAVKDLIPVKEGLTFGAWFSDGAELNARAAMPASSLTLTAKYRVGYVMQLFFENVAGNAYVGGDKVAEGVGYCGDTVTAEAPVYDDFYLHEEGAIAGGGTPVTSLTLGADAAKNVFRFYYDRARYNIYYDAGIHPGSASEGTMSADEVVYGGKATVPACGFSAEGYRFAGWGSTASGDAEEAYAPGKTFEVTGPKVLYAIWDKGYRDRFGSGDLIFFPRTDDGAAVLLRGGREFTGTRDGDSFSFTTAGGSEFSGKVFRDMFSYDHADLAGKYVLYSFGKEESYDEETTLEVDAYFGATFTENGIRYSGAVTYDENNGDYRFEGGGRSFNCLLGKSAVPGDAHPYYFAIAGGEGGVYMDFWVIDRTTGQGVSYGDVLILDGYGAATLIRSGISLPLGGTYYVEGMYGSASAPYYKVVCEIVDSFGIIGEEGDRIQQYFYTMPLPAEYGYNGYVFADNSRGAYTNGGDTLVLDGYGFFEDSATWTTADGAIRSGVYDVTTDYMTGTVATFTSEGQTYRFLLGSAGTFSLLEEQEDYVEYYRLSDALDYPLVVLYGDGRAEVYVTHDNGDTVLPGAKGTVKSEALGNGYTLYTFTRTEAIQDFEDETPRELVFYTTAVIGMEDFKPHGVYVTLKYNGEAYYDEIALTDGGTLWANRYPSLTGVGSLLFRNGQVTEGSFERNTGGYFSNDSAIFVYGDASGNRATLEFLIATADDGKLSAMQVQIAEQELYFYFYDEDLAQGRYAVDLVLDGQNNAVYNDDHGDGAWQRAAYAEADKTVFGDTVYSLSIGGEERFRFVIFLMPGAGGSTTPVYFIYDGQYAGEYVSDAGSLVLDGFFRAEYTENGRAERGTYAASSLSVVYFTGESGGRYFELSGDRVYPLDAAYGNYYLVDSSYAMIGGFIVTFDGRGGLTATNGRDERTGYYTVIDPALPELLITASFNDQYKYGEYRATLIYYENSNLYACVIYDAATYGYYVDDDWNVLVLDGYGLGTLYTADRGFAGDGYYYMVDEEKCFLDFTFNSATERYGSAAYLILDNENHKFTIQDYSSFGQVYFTPELDYITFGTDGTIYLGTLERGYYLVEENAVHAYVTDYTTDGFIHRILPAFTGGGTYEYNGKTYTLWDGGEISMEGTVRLFGEDGEELEGREPIEASIRFTPVRGSNYDLDAVFVIEEKEYEGFTLNFYTDSRLSPRVTYENVDYALTFDYHPGGESSFTVKAGFTSVTLQDYRDNYRDDAAHKGGMIVKEFIGFGPITLEGPYYSGKFHYLYDAASFTSPITFEKKSGEDVTVNAYRVGYGDGYEIVFDFGGKTYAVNFLEYDTYYTLLSFSRYELMEANDGYKVGVKYLEYCNVESTPGYGFLEEMRGKPCNATLFKEGKAVVSIDTGYALAGDAVWVVEYDPEKTANAGMGYYISFTLSENKVTAAEVETYTFRSAQSADRNYLAYMFFDGEGNLVHLLALGYLNGYGNYSWVGNAKDYQAEDGTFRFRATGDAEETGYTVRLEAAEGARYVLFVTEGGA